LLVKIDAAIREIAPLLVDRQQHFERQWFDGKRNRLCREQRPHEVFDGDAMGFQGCEHVPPTEGG
jgi:hypothetical protein